MSFPLWNVLVFPGSTEIGFEINRSLRDCKEVRLFSAGMPVPSAIHERFLCHDDMPAVNQDGWLDCLADIITRRGIDFIMPAHDDAVLALAEMAGRLPAHIVGSPLTTCRIARSKRATYEALAGAIPIPRLYTQAAEAGFPVFAKPDRGQGAQRARRIDTPAALAEALKSEPDLLISEFLPGPEYTVDCFTDRRRGLLYSRGRKRAAVRSGISVVTEFVDRPEFQRLAHAINQRLEFHGAWFFQVKENARGELTLLEVAPRLGGASGLSRASGINLALLSLYEQAGIEVAVKSSGLDFVMTRTLDSHFRCKNLNFSTVYFDLDDTLILNGAVNTRLIRFLFQCVNRGIKVVLLTKCRNPLPDVLKRHRLAGLFDAIIELKQDANKANYITEKDAIFIDDSFSERRSVADALGIPTFAPWMTECLIDERA